MNNRVVLGVAVRCNFSCFFFWAFLPTKHLGVHMKSFKCVRAFQIELEFESVGFWGKEKTGVPGEKPLGAWERTNNKLNPHNYGTDAGIWTGATLMGGECSHHCATLAPQTNPKWCTRKDWKDIEQYPNRSGGRVGKRTRACNHVSGIWIPNPIPLWPPIDCQISANQHEA